MLVYPLLSLLILALMRGGCKREYQKKSDADEVGREALRDLFPSTDTLRTPRPTPCGFSTMIA